MYVFRHSLHMRFLYAVYGATIGEFPCRGSPFASLSLRYESNISVDADVAKVKYWCLAFESSVLTIIRIGLLIHLVRIYQIYEKTKKLCYLSLRALRKNACEANGDKT